MSFFKVHLTAGLFLVLAIGYTGSVIHSNLTKTTYKHDESIVHHNKENSDEYYHFRHLDGNLDGVITKLEVINSGKFSAPPEAYAFAKTLSPADQRLVNGLSFEVAKKAIHDLNDSEKSALLHINLAERVSLINSRFA